MHCSNAVRRAVRAQTLLAPHKGMQRHSDKNSSTLREDVSCWCWPNDCSRSGALQCTARYEDRTLRTPPRNSSGIAKSRLRDRRDSFIPSCLQGQDDNVQHQPVGQTPRSPASSTMYVPAPCAPPLPPMPPIRILWPHFYTDGSDIQRGNQLQIGNYFGNSASKKRGDSNVCCTNESFWTPFMHMKQRRAEKSGSATRKCCKNAKDRSI